MRRLTKLWRTLGVFAGVGLLAACVITTEKPFFTESDFVQPKVLSGDWQRVPTKESPEVLKIRLDVKGKIIRAQPLTDEGAVDEGEEPIDLGVIPLDPGRYVVEHVENDGSASYVGLEAQEGRLTFYLFYGGDSEAAETAFKGALIDLEISRDANFTSETRLASKNLSAEKIKALFAVLLKNPGKYEPAVIEYEPAK